MAETAGNFARRRPTTQAMVSGVTRAAVVPILDAEQRSWDLQGVRPFARWLESKSRAPPEAAAVPARAPPLAPLRALVEGALQGERAIDAVLAAAASGGTFSAGELLSLQIKAFRYSQTVEILSRAADRVVAAVRQTLGTQV